MFVVGQSRTDARRGKYASQCVASALSFQHVALMPDAHLGKGSMVGSVIATKDAIIPATVGVDIGCFTGDTLVPLLDGKSYPLRDLAQSAEEFVVYAAPKAEKSLQQKQPPAKPALMPNS